MEARAWRFVFFALTILAGLTAGLVYGWVINPVQPRSTSPDSLQIDYRADFVLMVAELYHADGDLALALARLGFLGNTSPILLMNETISHGDALRYADSDLQLMRSLAFDIKGALEGTN